MVFVISIIILPWFIETIHAGYVPGNMNTFPNLGMGLGEKASTWFLFFLGNFYRGWEVGAVPFALGVLWSVCVE